MDDPPASAVVELRVKIPRLWRDQLKEAAGIQAVSMSDLIRLILRSFLRQQHTAAERERLER